MADPQFISPEEEYGFNSRRRQARRAFKDQRAALKYQKNTLKTNQAADQRSLGREWDTMRSKLPGSYVGRGLMNSGIWGQGLTDYGLNRDSAYADSARNYQTQYGDIRLQKHQSKRDYMTQMADIAEQEKMRRASVASALRQMGGL